jgi:hypothetical protein
LSLDVGDSVSLSHGFAMDGILQTLDELLQVSDAVPEGMELLVVRATRR